MNNYTNELWIQFLTTGKVNDYLKYKEINEDYDEWQQFTNNNQRPGNQGTQ